MLSCSAPHPDSHITWKALCQLTFEELYATMCSWKCFVKRETVVSMYVPRGGGGGGASDVDTTVAVAEDSTAVTMAAVQFVAITLRDFLCYYACPKQVAGGEGRLAAYTVLHLPPSGSCSPSASAHPAAARPISPPHSGTPIPGYPHQLMSSLLAI
ncbi:hypothetical protein E2C01_097679 [Portunus trituberculatus]|uniref:Uncharacterized protein n=1 Tax=Portunus trituberculatus TaxID=210409 RepID=A0A5B7K520_PORTR|nr:hypothetical protein [Portunus trituberculatus]